jgi:arylsulfatase A-like enzyme
LQNEKKLGIVPQNTTLLPRDASVKAWDQLNSTEKSYEAKKMEVFTAMAAESDNQVGKLLDHLKQIGQYNNTMIIFTSDNGPEGSTPEKETFGGPGIRAELAKVIAATNNSEANLGNANSYLGYGPGWAHVINHNQ